jgi:hypothetical protein
LRCVSVDAGSVEHGLQLAVPVLQPRVLALPSSATFLKVRACLVVTVHCRQQAARR